MKEDTVGDCFGAARRCNDIGPRSIALGKWGELKRTYRAVPRTVVPWHLWVYESSRLS